MKLTPARRRASARYRWLSCATGLLLVGAAPQVLAADCENLSFYTATTRCEVPKGMNIANIRVDAAGGGAGGMHASSLGPPDGGSAGAHGSTIAGAVQLSPGDVMELWIGAGGQQGDNASGTPTAGGSAGAGYGPGGAGGGGAQGGGGGGGGGASSLHIADSAMWVRAGGGGGGGGGGSPGSTAGDTSLSHLSASEPCLTAASAAGDGGAVDPLTANGASGGGGGNGGTYRNAPSTHRQGAAASTVLPAHGAEGGFTGDSCASNRVEALFYEAVGNAAGGNNANAASRKAAEAGSIFLIFAFDPDRTAMIAAISATGVVVQQPTAMPPGFEVSTYQVTCTNAAGGSVSGTAPGPSTSAHVPMALPGGQLWTCEVIATLIDPVSGDTLHTIATTAQSNHPTITPRTPARVPVAGAAVAASAGVLAMAAWMGLRRRRAKTQP
ncbi:hypothetical protein [Comamonas piscis]